MCCCLDNVEDEDIKEDSELSCCMSCRVTCFDIFWPIIKKCVEITTMGCLIFYGRYEYALITLLIILLPGSLECYYWIMSFDCHTNTMKCCLWIFFFNPIFFPFTIIAWHVTVICQGAKSYRKKFSVSKALSSLQILTESFWMLLLQSYILANAWGAYPTVPIGRIIDIDYSYLHVACAFFSLTSLAKEYSEHHTYELSGKSGIPSCRYVTSGFFYYITIIILRLPSLLLLLLLFRYWFSIYVGMLVFVNGILVFLTLRPSFSKTAWTCCTSIAAPTCFISRFKINTYEVPGDSFHRYYLWNSIAFFAFSMLGHMLANVLLYIEGETIKSNIGDDVPYLSLSNNECWKADRDGECTNVHLASCVAVFSAFIQILLTWAQHVFCSFMRGSEDHELEYFV